MPSSCVRPFGVWYAASNISLTAVWLCCVLWTGCGELPEGLEMALKLMVPGEVSGRGSGEGGGGEGAIGRGNIAAVGREKAPGWRRRQLSA